MLLYWQVSLPTLAIFSNFKQFYSTGLSTSTLFSADALTVPICFVSGNYLTLQQTDTVCKYKQVIRPVSMNKHLEIKLNAEINLTELRPKQLKNPKVNVTLNKCILWNKEKTWNKSV